MPSFWEYLSVNRGMLKAQEFDPEVLQWDVRQDGR